MLKRVIAAATLTFAVVCPSFAADNSPSSTTSGGATSASPGAKGDTAAAHCDQFSGAQRESCTRDAAARGPGATSGSGMSGTGGTSGASGSGSSGSSGMSGSGSPGAATGGSAGGAAGSSTSR